MGFRILVVSREEVETYLPIGECVEIVTKAFRALALQQAELSPKYHWEFRVGRSGAFASHVVPMDAMAIKVATIRPGNQAIGLPRSISLILLQRPETGEPLALIDGTSVTAMRTGAAAAVGARALARPQSEVVAILGPGPVGRTSLAALATSFSIKRVFVVGTSVKSQVAFIEEAKKQFSFDFVMATAKEAAEAADIIVTATPSTEPIVLDAWVQQGTHISAMGADWKGKQELDEAILKRSRFVTDNRLQCIEIGEGNVPYAAGHLDEADIAAEIGEILADLRPGRHSDNEITVFASSGIGVQDAAVARWIYDSATRRGFGSFSKV